MVLLCERAYYFAVRYVVEYGLDFYRIVYTNTNWMRGGQRVEFQTLLGLV